MTTFRLSGLCSLAAWFLLLAAISGTIYAQGLGTVVGTVTDPSGATIPGATVKITDEATSLTREITTNAQGYYVLPLPAALHIHGSCRCVWFLVVGP